LDLEEVIAVPKQPYDEIGHADGMLRFLQNDTVLVNDYSRESKRFQSNFTRSLEQAKLNIEQIPYNPYLNKNNLDATGVYMNYLQMKDADERRSNSANLRDS
jgi:agmatine deiminase